MTGEVANHQEQPSPVPTGITHLVEQILVRVLGTLDEKTLPRIACALESLADSHQNAQLLRPPAKYSANEGPHPAFEHF
jgi:hypothetical protein